MATIIKVDGSLQDYTVKEPFEAAMMTFQTALKSGELWFQITDAETGQKVALNTLRVISLHDIGFDD